MIVDCHVNVWDDEHVNPLYAEGARFARAATVSPAADPDTVVAAMAGVDAAIVFSLRYGDSAGIDGNDEVTARAVAKAPEKLVGFAAMDPRRPDYMDLLRYAHGTLGLKGVKFGPIYNRVGLDDPRLEPVYAFCVANNLPLTMHMGTTFAQNSTLDFGRPLHVDAVAARHPDLKLIMAHMGHPWVEECIAVVRKRANVYCEVSALFYRPWQFFNALVAAQEYGVADRDKIFWGTDFPFTGVAESIAGLKNINALVEGTNLPRVGQQTIDRILHANPFEHWWHGGLKR